MDCPSCGLANPPEALNCDCGYDFSAGKAADFPGWEISLAWRQKVAAFWSISWPAWIGSMGLVILLTSGYSIDLLQDNFSVIALGGNLAFFDNSGASHPPFGAKELPVISPVRGPRRRKQEPGLVDTGGSLGLALDSRAAICASSARVSSCMVLGCEASSGHRPRVLVDVAMDSFPGRGPLRRGSCAPPKVSGLPAGGPRVSVRISARRWQLADAHRVLGYPLGRKSPCRGLASTRAEKAAKNESSRAAPVRIVGRLGCLPRVLQLGVDGQRARQHLPFHQLPYQRPSSTP